MPEVTPIVRGGVRGPQLPITRTGEPVGIQRAEVGERSGSRAVLGWAQGLAVLFVDAIYE